MFYFAQWVEGSSIMHARFAGTLMGICLIWAPIAPAHAQDTDASQRMQQQQQQAQAEMQRAMRQQGFRPTRATPLEQSLEDLLNGGYGIVSAEQATTGPAFTLRAQDGRKWVFCTLASRPSNELQPSLESLCRALN